MIQVQKKSKFTACLPAIQQKSLSPHETSLFCLQIQQKLSLKKTKSTTPFACNQAKNLSPHETSLRDRFTVKKTKYTDWTISLHTTLPNSHIALLEHSEHLPPLLYSMREGVPDCPSGGQKGFPSSFFPSAGGRPRLPSTEGNLGRPSQFALHRGQTGTKSSQIALQKGNLGRFWPEEGILGRFWRASQGALPYYLCTFVSFCHTVIILFSNIIS